MIWNSLQERSVSWLEVARGGTFAIRLPGLRPESSLGHPTIMLPRLGPYRVAMIKTALREVIGRWASNTWG